MVILADLGSVLSSILYIFLALLILLFMITIHELGHFTAGKLLGFKINEFAIGMGPKLFSRKSKKSGQVFSLRLVPLGGYCAFEGEDEENPSEQAFNNQKPWKRLIVLFSGAFMNFISAVVIVIIAFTFFGDVVPQIAKTYPKDNPDDIVLFVEGDRILEIDGKKVLLSIDISKMIRNAPETCNVLVIRDGKQVLLEGVKKSEYTLKDESGNTATYTGWGINILTGGPEVSRVNFTFGQAITRSVPYCFRTAGYVLETLGQLVTGLIGLNEIGGPITTIDITSQVARTGLGNVLMLITLISVNLAVFNLLPVPALDGSRMIFVLIEWVFKKPVNRKIEGIIHFTGLILLFSFVILVDLLRLFSP